AGLDRIVAVKLLLGAKFAGDEERERFHREARTAARLRHPGIVGIFDIGEDDDVPWFSMEFVGGKNLEQLVRGQPMSAKDAARCVRKIAAALQHAHGHDVLHRDLKPSNILIDAGGEPQIGDFGIASISAGQPDLTRTGQTLGSPGYAAPELVLAGKADKRTDVYGLGAVLYHLLGGRPPFTGPTPDAVLVQLRESDPLPPRKLNPDVPRDLETICLKCLEKKPEGRYETAGEVADDLARFLENKPIHARPPDVVERTWRWAVRHPGMAALIGTIVLLVSGFVVSVVSFARHQARMEHRTSLVSESRVARQSRLAGARPAALAKLREAWEIAPSREIRDEAVAFLALPDISMPVRVDAKAPDPTRSADGKFHAVFQGDVLVVMETATGREVVRLEGEKAGSGVKLDDHGTRIAIAAPKSGVLRVISLSSKEELAVCRHPLPLQSLDWSGDLLATGCENRFIYIWNDRGELKHRLSGHEAPTIRVAFRPGSQELASTSADPHVNLWHAARGTWILRREASHSAHGAVWWSKDGRKFFGAVEDGMADEFSLPAAQCLEVLSPPQDEPHSNNLGSASFSNDGRLAAVVDEVSARVWDFESGRLVLEQASEPGQWLSARFSADSGLLWTCGFSHELTERALEFPQEGPITAGPPRVIHRGHGSLLRDGTPDGRLLLMSNNGFGKFLVFSPGKPAAPLQLDHPGTMACTMGPAGDWVATSSFQSRGLRIWSVPEGKIVSELCAGETVMQAAALGDDRLIVRTSAATRIFRSGDWSEEKPPGGPLKLNGLTASRDGKLVATLADNGVRLLETQGFTETLRLTLPDHVGWPGESHLVFDEEGDHLLIHTALGVACRWDIKTTEDELRKAGLTGGP
ncbi:MAG: hypothetical protein EOP88_18835, partial [Verrucomicrobiaceae bacterium]